MKRRSFIALIVVMLVSMATVSRAAASPPTENSGSPYYAVMPGASSYPTGYFTGRELFYSYGEDLSGCRPVSSPCATLTADQRFYEVRQIVWDQNAQLAIDNGIIDGARTWAFGPGFQMYAASNSSIPGIWLAVARFRSASGARATADGFLSPVLGRFGAPYVSSTTSVGPDNDVARHVVGDDVAVGHVEQLTFAHGNVAVMIYMSHTDNQQVMRLAQQVDATLTATGFGQPAPTFKLFRMHLRMSPVGDTYVY